MLQRFFATGLAFFCLAGTAISQTTATPSDSVQKPKIIFTGAADAYYRYDSGKSADNNNTSFTNSQNSFELGMISLKAEHTIGKVGMVADIGFGKRAEEFSYNDGNTRLAIKQLYLSYTLKNSVKFTAGSWATHVGYELVDAYGNRNYSMSYMFSYGPFFHTGVKAEKTFGKTAIMLGIANPTDLKSTSTKSKFVIGQLSTATKNDKVKIYLNYQGGKPTDSVMVNQVDLVLTAALSPKFTVGFDGTITGIQTKRDSEKFGDASEWYGAAVYLQADPLSWLGMTLRTEYFNDDNQLNVFSGAGTGGNILATTFSVNLKSEGLTIIPEIRFEKASAEIYTKSDKATDTCTSFLVAAVYKF